MARPDFPLTNSIFLAVASYMAYTAMAMVEQGFVSNKHTLLFNLSNIVIETTRFGGKGSANESVNQKAVCSIALSTQGLLISFFFG